MTTPNADASGFDVSVPATEIEVSNAMNQTTHNPVGVIRKLAFERDKLTAQLAALTQQLAAAERERERMLDLLRQV